MTKQEAAIKYITENYLEFNRLRHDVIADKLQLRLLGDEAKGERQEYWKELTKHDINSIVCHCAQEYDANITSREVMTALQSDLIPDVHPLREYILSLPAWKPESGDWIDFVASQVRVKNNDNKVSGNNNDNTDNLRPNQYPLGAQGEENTQQPKQLDSTTFRSQQHSERLGEAYKNDNIDNFRPNQLSRATGDIDLKQLQNNNKNNLLREKQLISRSGVEIKEKQDVLQSDRSSGCEISNDRSSGCEISNNRSSGCEISNNRSSGCEIRTLITTIPWGKNTATRPEKK